MDLGMPASYDTANGSGNFRKYIKVQNLLLSLCAEQGDLNQINSIKERLQDMVLRGDIELDSMTHFTLGSCSLFKKNYNGALDYFKKSISLAMHENKKFVSSNLLLL